MTVTMRTEGITKYDALRKSYRCHTPNAGESHWRSGHARSNKRTRTTCVGIAIAAIFSVSNWR